MSQDNVFKIYEFIVFLFAISVHESAHAWVALRCGDPTAYMLGRVTLNPIKHIDPIGTVLLPLVAMFTFGGILGWAKPTPVNPRNFKHVMRDDILTSVAGPASNIMLALISLVLMIVVAAISPAAREMIKGLANPSATTMPGGGSVLVPIVILLYFGMILNILLAIFNLIPVPPLDGSHVLRHFLSGTALTVYDNIGRFGLLLLFLVGGRVIYALYAPVEYAFRVVLYNLT
jgi:Zn-dependent protease